MAAAQAERAFERVATLDGHGGSGLGLAIGRELARAQDGELMYRDGAFVLILPADVRPDAPVAAPGR